MAKVIAFKVVIEGVERAISNEKELAAAVKAVSKAYKSAEFGSSERSDQEKQLKRLQQVQADLKDQYNAEAVAAKKAAKEAAKAAKDRARQEREAAKSVEKANEERSKSQQRADDITAESIRGLKAELRLVQDEYESLSREERGVAGKPLLNRIAQLKTELGQYRQEVRDTARDQAVAGGKAEGSYRALNAELVNLRRQYRELGKAERQVVGQDLLTRIAKLDKELKELDADMGQYQRNVGNYASALDGVGEALVGAAGVDFASLATPAGFITAAGSAAVATTKYVKDLTEEYRSLQAQVEALTGTEGERLDALTREASSIAQTFDRDANEILRAANAYSESTGITYEDAFNRITNGLATGLDTNGEYLDSLLEFGPAFKEVFGEGEAAANAFQEVIRRGNEQGIFNDRAVDVINEARTRLRELTPATREAIEGIGLASEDIEKLVSEKNIGAAIAKISTQVQTLRDDAPEVGAILADVYGGVGEDGGLDFVKSLGDIDQATKKVIDTSSDYAQQKLKEKEAIDEFVLAQEEVAKAFGTTGSTMDSLVTRGQALFLRFLVPVINFFGDLFDALRPIGGMFVDLARDMGLVNDKGEGTLDVVGGLNDVLSDTVKEVETVVGWLTSLEKGLNSVSETVNGAGKSVNSFFRNLLGLGEAIEDTPNFGGGGAGAGYGEVADEVDENTESQKKNNEESKKSIRSLATMKAELGRLQKSYEKLDVNSSAFTRTGKRIAELKDEIAKYEGRTKAAAVATEKFARDSIGFLQAQLSDLQTELTGAVSGSDQERSLIEDILGVEQAIEKLQDARVKIRNEIARLGDDITPVSILPETDAEIDQLSQTQSALERQTDEFQDRLNERIIENTKSREETVTRNTLHEAERRADSLQKILAIADEATGRIGNIATSLEQGVSARANQQINEIQARYAAEIEAAEGNADRQEELREQQVEAEREVRQKELEAAKKYQIAALLASSAAGVINILSAQSLIPQPLSSVFKAAQITALALSTAKQVKAIRSQTIAARGGIFEDEDVRPVSPRTRRRRRAERNYKVMQGWVRGQSHNGPGGGVPLTLNGHNVLAEDGEFIDYDENGNVIVINKRSAANHRKELNGMYGRSFRGKGVTLDHINRFRGFGRPIFDEGGIIEPRNLDGIALLNAQHNGTYAQVFGPQSESPQAELSDEAAAKIAAAAARAIYEAGRKGVADGAADANRRRERQERLDKRTGK